MDTKFLNWFLSGGSVAVPKRFLAYMATLELSFEELGEIVYLLAQEGRVSAATFMQKPPRPISCRNISSPTTSTAATCRSSHFSTACSDRPPPAKLQLRRETQQKKRATKPSPKSCAVMKKSAASSCLRSARRHQRSHPALRLVKRSRLRPLRLFSAQSAPALQFSLVRPTRAQCGRERSHLAAEFCQRPRLRVHKSA